MPVLNGKYARQFERDLEANKGKKIPREEYNAAMRNYRSVRIEPHTKRGMFHVEPNTCT